MSRRNGEERAVGASPGWPPQMSSGGGVCPASFLGAQRFACALGEQAPVVAVWDGPVEQQLVQPGGCGVGSDWAASHIGPSANGVGDPVDASTLSSASCATDAVE